MMHDTRSARPLLTPGGWIRRATTSMAHLLLLILGIGGWTAGLVLVVGSDMLERIETPVAMGGGLICAATGCAALQELILLGRLRLYKFYDPGKDFTVPFSPLPVLSSAFGAVGCAIWAFWFFKTFGLSWPPFLFGALAIALSPVVITCWRRKDGPMKLDSTGVSGVSPIDGRIAWGAATYASIASRFGLPVIRLQKKADANGSANLATERMDFFTYDFGVSPRAVVEIINRRIEATGH